MGSEEIGLRGSEWRSRTLDERTDRLYRRLTGWPAEGYRDTYRWAMLRLDIAGRDMTRAIRLELTPAYRQLGATMDAARRQLGELARTLGR